MKKILSILFICLLLVGCSNKTEVVEKVVEKEVPVAVSDYVDSYASSSHTRIPMVGADFDSAIDELTKLSNDLATKAVASEANYKAPENSKLANIMSVNPDGSISMSTIHAWKVEKNENGATIKVVMTDGQTIQNLVKAIGTRGTIMVHGDKYYIMHVETSDIVNLEYSDESYNAGLFNVDYSGAENGACEYTVTFNIYMLETSFVYMFD